MTDFTTALGRDPAFREAYEANRPRRELALALRRMRKARGLTQADVAARTGMSQSHVSKLEAATGPMPELDTMRRYAEACGMAIRIDFQPLTAGAARPARPRAAARGRAASLAASVAVAAAAGAQADVVRVAHLTEAQAEAAQRGETVLLEPGALAAFQVAL